MLLDKCVKSPVAEQPSRDNMLEGPNTCGICVTVILSCFFITPGKTESKNVSVSDM